MVNVSKMNRYGHSLCCLFREANNDGITMGGTPKTNPNLHCSTTITTSMTTSTLTAPIIPDLLVGWRKLFVPSLSRTCCLGTTFEWRWNLFNVRGSSNTCSTRLLSHSFIHSFILSFTPCWTFFPHLPFILLIFKNPALIPLPRSFLFL